MQSVTRSALSTIFTLLAGMVFFPADSRADLDPDSYIELWLQPFVNPPYSCPQGKVFGGTQSRTCRYSARFIGYSIEPKTAFGPLVCIVSLDCAFVPVIQPTANVCTVPGESPAAIVGTSRQLCDPPPLQRIYHDEYTPPADGECSYESAPETAIPFRPSEDITLNDEIIATLDEHCAAELGEPPPDAELLALCCREQCGDGNLDENEGCDDGNTASGDGCDGGCEIEPIPSPTPTDTPDNEPTPSPTDVPTPEPSPGPSGVPTDTPPV